MSKNTLGSVSSELFNSDHGSINPQEIQKAQEKEYLDNLIWCVNHAKKKVDCSSIDGHDACKNRSSFDGDFYIAALIKKERLLENVLRNYFIPTLSCPTPHFDQTVYRYNHLKEEIEFLWVIPDQETCEIFKENVKIIVPGEQQLLSFVLRYYNGDLFNMAKRLNGESMFAGSALESEVIK